MERTMPHPRTAPFLAPLLILIGVLVTLENFQLIGCVSAHWPLLLMMLGLGFLMLFYQRRRSDAVLLWLGSCMTILALFFYYLNFTAWSRLARQWPIFLGIVGLGFLVLGLDTRRPLYLYFTGAFIAPLLKMGGKRIVRQWIAHNRPYLGYLRDMALNRSPRNALGE